MRRAVLFILVTFLFSVASTTASAMEEESAEPRVPVTLSYQDGGQSKVDQLEVDPVQALTALKKRGVTTFGELVAANPAALGASLTSEVTGLGASAGPPLGAVLIASARRSIDDRNAGKTVKLGSILGEATNEALRSLEPSFGLAATKLTAGHVSVLLNPSRTYRAVVSK